MMTGGEATVAESSSEGFAESKAERSSWNTILMPWNQGKTKKNASDVFQSLRTSVNEKQDWHKKKTKVFQKRTSLELSNIPKRNIASS